MKYKSTRGGVSDISFKDAVMMGLASDGGLLVPDAIPDLTSRLPSLVGLSYPELATEIMSHFISDISRDDLASLVERSYQSFSDDKVTPLVQVGDLHILELFHGPTLAFKDVALQFLGNVFELILQERQTRVKILGATSGDTGSAAIAGIRGKDNIDIFIMFPEGKTSPLQELQMTSILDSNVHNIGIDGSFDDCQQIMKTIFSDLPFKETHNLAAVNSVNWTRVLAQVVYFFSAYSQLGAPAKFDVTVPTGNFGNIFAAYVAKKMGLPIRRLLLATNANDILSRFFISGVYERQSVNFTHSPAMDIQVASNFERYLYYSLAEDGDRVTSFMKAFLENGTAQLPFNTRTFDESFVAGAVSNDDTLAMIRQTYADHAYIADPHTAVGLCVANEHLDETVPMVCLATAHPAKFDDVMKLALPEVVVSHPTLEALRDQPTRKQTLGAEVDAIKALIQGF
ncbi:MAG: threonine synthase [Candidatus Azotimanducaceae bacterium]|jgi:threonine synthase